MFVDFLDDLALKVRIGVHAAGPDFALTSEAVVLVLATLEALHDYLLSKCLLHVWLQGQFRVGRHVSCQLLFVDLARHNRIDCLITARWELVAHLSGELGAQLSIGLLLGAHRALDLLGKLLRVGVAHS